MALADDIAVMRDGELASHGSAADFDTARMITLMLGRPIDQIHPERQSRLRGDSLLSVHGLSSPGIIKNVSFALHSGEVVGLFGLMGSGRTELAQMLFGLDNHASGEVAVRDQPLPAVHSPRQSIRHGIAFVTENRREEGLMMDGSVGDNIVLAALPSLAVTPIEFVDRFRARHAALELSDALQIKTSSIEAPARSLSGGNQQKVVVAKWLMAEPSIFILDEPTRGIDVGAKYEIYSFIDRLTKGGSGILFISSELDELMAVSDRILVMSRGEVVDEFAREAFDSQRILAAAFREQGAAA
jgi:ribose transport system ATP-binding protein